MKIFTHYIKPLLLLSAFVTLSVLPAYAAKTIKRGDTPTITYSVQNAPNCTGTILGNYSPQSEVDGWVGKIHSANNTSFTFPKLTAVGTFTFGCSYSVAGQTFSNEDQLTIEECGGPLSPGTTWDTVSQSCLPPPVASFASINPNNLRAGDNVAMSWSATNNPTRYDYYFGGAAQIGSAGQLAVLPSASLNAPVAPGCSQARAYPCRP
jgi:hypothetical protein